MKCGVSVIEAPMVEIKTKMERRRNDDGSWCVCPCLAWALSVDWDQKLDADRLSSRDSEGPVLGIFIHLELKGLPDRPQVSV